MQGKEKEIGREGRGRKIDIERKGEGDSWHRIKESAK